MPEPYASFVKSLMLTGQRLREVAGMQWAEVDLDKAQWIIPVARTKNGRDHLVPLAPSMVALLAGRFPKKESRKGPVFTTGGGKPLNGPFNHGCFTICGDRLARVASRWGFQSNTPRRLSTTYQASAAGSLGSISYGNTSPKRWPLWPLGIGIYRPLSLVEPRT
jgi:integrase